MAKVLVRYRKIIQSISVFLCNIHLPNFFRGEIFSGKAKLMCVPGLNCYSCPAAAGSCPIGSLQATIGASQFRFAYYITGILILFGLLLGRFICGFLCPFGWFQELLNKIPVKKFSTRKLRPLQYVKYIILILMVIILPAVLTNELGIGKPFFCKYLCPQGTLEGAIPLSLVNSGIRSALGTLFKWKLGLLFSLCILSTLYYRPFCKWFCPLGAFYGLFNKVSVLRLKVDSSSCVSCGCCSRICRMDVNVTKTPNHTECIRCGMCMKNCPKEAIKIHHSFRD